MEKIDWVLDFVYIFTKVYIGIYLWVAATLYLFFVWHSPAAEPLFWCGLFFAPVWFYNQVKKGKW